MSYRANDINEEFFLAAQTGDLVNVKALKVKGAQLDCSRRAENNYTPLHSASENGHIHIVDFLLSSDADPSSVASGNITPLHLAATKGHSKIAGLLLSHGANINSQTEKGSTPLLSAVKNNHREVVSLLLKQGACVNTKDNENNTPLYLVVEEKKWSLANIVDYKPKIDDKINQAIIRSIKHGNDIREVVRYLIERGFTIDHEDENDSNLLLAAVKRGYTAIVERLLANSADPNDGRRKPSSLLFISVQNRDIEMTQLLLKYGCDINVEDERGDTPICYSFLIRSSSEEAENFKMFSLLVASGADIKKGLKLLHSILEPQYFEVCKILIDNGADVNSLDGLGYAPLHRAVSYDYCSEKEGGETVRGNIAKLLLSNGADVNLKIDKYTYSSSTALHVAASEGNSEAVCILLDFGADINARGENDSTPLHLAIENQQDEVIITLLENLCDINIERTDKKTALECAISKAHHSRSIAEHRYFSRKENTERRGHWHYDSDDDHFNRWSDSDKSDDDFYYDPYRDSDDDYDPYHNRRNPYPRQYNINDNWMVKTLKKHIIQLKVAGFYVTEKILNSLDVSRKNSLLVFQQECEVEVSQMKKQKYCHHLTLHDFLVNSRNPVFIRNVSLNKSLVCSEYPIYGSLLVNSFNESKRINELLNVSPVWLDTLLKTSNLFSKTKLPILPVEILEKIASYLNKTDLKNLIFCGQSLKRKVCK